MNPEAIALRNIRRSFDQGGVQALQGISLTLRAGEFVALMGPSGSGKTTLLNIMGALDTEFEGEITVDGQNLQRLAESPAFRARVIGFIFQSFHLLPTLTALENVQMPMFEMPWAAPKRRERAGELLESLGVKAVQDRVPGKLSSGERQRVAIARSLANGPKILLADEPTGNLDSANATGILDVLQKLHRENGMTIVMVTHDATVAARAQRTIRMKDGRLEDG